MTIAVFLSCPNFPWLAKSPGDVGGCPIGDIDVSMFGISSLEIIAQLLSLPAMKVLHLVLLLLHFFYDL